jgi:hypothetical protein
LQHALPRGTDVAQLHLRAQSLQVVGEACGELLPGIRRGPQRGDEFPLRVGANPRWNRRHAVAVVSVGEQGGFREQLAGPGRVQHDQVIVYRAPHQPQPSRQYLEHGGDGVSLTKQVLVAGQLALARERLQPIAKGFRVPHGGSPARGFRSGHPGTPSQGSRERSPAGEADMGAPARCAGSLPRGSPIEIKRYRACLQRGQ